MIKKKFVKIFFLIILFSILFFVVYLKFFKKVETSKIDLKPSVELEYKSNIIKDINYTTKDADGNEYIIKAAEAEIDYSNTNILFLTNVWAIIKIKNSENIVITSDFGKYNTVNFDTIFSKNVIIKYLENKISGEYLDFSLERNSMIISREIILSNFENILKADVIEIDIKTKDTKIFMYENEEKVNIQSIN
tara:strand:- start:460 stop:1035 length:576 start_codon:yes stop_codon:yes gene_type:complete